MRRRGGCRIWSMVPRILLFMGLGIGSATCRPAVWMFPPPDENGLSLRELLNNPASWQSTRSRIDGIAYADHWLNSQFSDSDLRALFRQLATWHLRLGLEVGALKPWGLTADRAFAADAEKWDRFIADGARIDHLAMDEPLAFARSSLHAGSDFAAGQVAQFVALSRRRYPGTAIGDIEPYPGIPASDLLAFLDDVQARLHQMNIRGLDFVRLDVDWMHFRAGDPIRQEGWQGVRDLQQQINRRGIRFSLIYWAADYPSLARAGLANVQSWEASILRQGADYAAVGGAPDEAVIENWVHAPGPATPETEPGTFTRSVFDFTTRFAH